MSTLETALSVLLVAVLAVVCITCLLRAPRRLRAPEHAWFAASIATLLVYLVAPDSIGDGAQITPRLLLFFLFTVLMWIAVFPLPRRTLTLMVGGAVAISIGLSAFHFPKYVGFNRDLKEYAEAGAHMTKGSTVLPINLVVPGDDVPGLESSRRIRPIIQASGFLVAKDGVLDLSHFQGQYGYFITQFRDALNPFDLIANGKNWLDDTTPDLNLLDYPKLTNGEGNVDYVIVWGANVAGEDVLTSREVQSIDQQLASAYDLVFTSSRGHLQLYKLRGSG